MSNEIKNIIYEQCKVIKMLTWSFFTLIWIVTIGLTIPAPGKGESKNSLIPKKVESVEIQYSLPTNYSGSDIENYSIKVEGDDLNTLKDMLQNVKKSEFDFASCDCYYSFDQYKIVINQDKILTIGEEYGTVINRKNEQVIIDVDEQFYQLVDRIVYEYNVSHVYRNIETDILSMEANHKVIDIDNGKEVSDILNNIPLIPITLEGEYQQYGSIAYTIDYKNGQKLYIYEDFKTGYLEDGENSTYVELDSRVNLEDYLTQKQNQTKHSFELIGGLQEGDVCAEAIEEFTVDGVYQCSFSCIMSGTYQVKVDDKIYTLEEAIREHIVTIEELQKEGLPCV